MLIPPKTRGISPGIRTRPGCRGTREVPPGYRRQKPRAAATTSRAAGDQARRSRTRPESRLPTTLRTVPGDTARRVDWRSHLLTSNIQRLRKTRAAIAIVVSTSKASTPRTSKGPPTLKSAMAARPAACTKRAARRRGKRLPRKSATGIMSAVERDPRRSLAEPVKWNAEPGEVPSSGLPACSPSRTYMAMRERLARMPVIPAA